MKDERKSTRVNVALGKLDKPLRTYANERNISLNAAICVAVSKLVDGSRN